MPLRCGAEGGRVIVDGLDGLDVLSLSGLISLRLLVGRDGNVIGARGLVIRLPGARLLSLVGSVLSGLRLRIGPSGRLSRRLRALCTLIRIGGLGDDGARGTRSARGISSIGRCVVGQVAARTQVGEDLDVPGTGQPAEQVGIGRRVGRQRRPQVGPALRDRGLQGLVRSLRGDRRIGLMRRHHELNRIHAGPFRENV